MYGWFRRRNSIVVLGDYLHELTLSFDGNIVEIHKGNEIQRISTDMHYEFCVIQQQQQKFAIISFVSGDDGGKCEYQTWS